MKADKRSKTYSQIKEACTLLGVTNKGQLQKTNKALYEYARIKGYLDRLSDDLDWICSRRLSKEECQKAALKYRSKVEFKKMDQSSYVFSRKHVWLDEICSHMTPLKRNDLDYEKCKEIAAKYSTRSDLAKGDSTVSKKIRDNKWFELLSHMITQGDFSNKLIYEIKKGNKVYIGHTSNTHKRLLGHLRKGSAKELLEEGAKLTVLTNVMPINEALETEKKLIEKYKKEGYQVLNKTIGGEPGGGVKVWTDKLIKRACLGFESKAHLRNDPNGRKVFSVIQNRLSSLDKSNHQDFWKKIAPHFPQADRRNQGRREGWLSYSNDEMAKIASQYSRASDMKDSKISNHKSVYFKILRLGLKEKLAPHWKIVRKKGSLSDREIIKIGLSFESRLKWAENDKYSQNLAYKRGLLANGTKLSRHFSKSVGVQV